MKVYTQIDAFKNVNNPILTTGTFDGVHKGHQCIIKQLNEIAKNEEGESVLLTFHPHPRLVLFPNDNGLKLIHTQVEKIERLREAGLQHLIIYPFSKSFSRLTYVEYVRDILVNGIGVKKLVIGYDHQFGRNREGSYTQLEELAPLYDFEVMEIPAETVDDVNVSSTKVRKAILNGDLALAREYLGDNFQLSGKVVPGDKIGREIGFPTANIEVEESHKIIPGNGVYAVRVKHLNSSCKGMMNIGVRPTVSGEMQHRIEVHIFDFSKEIYGDQLTIEFVARIRDERKFETKEALKAQLKQDELTAVNML